jgi:hypothetical protein
MFRVALLSLVLMFAAHGAFDQANCPASVDPRATAPLHIIGSTTGCRTSIKGGYPLPDSNCTPGAVNPTVTLAVLQAGSFRTPCERNVISSMHEKNATYTAYDIVHPAHNTGNTQICELDHLVSLEIGGSDGISNIWPQCGPDDVGLRLRYFKQKDMVEDYIAALIKDHTIDTDEKLKSYQQGIATDWTQYLNDANTYWGGRRPEGFGSDQ